MILLFYKIAFSQIWDAQKNNFIELQLMHTIRFFNPLWGSGYQSFWEH